MRNFRQTIHILLYFILIFTSVSNLFSQDNDISIQAAGSVNLVGPTTICPSSSVSFTVNFKNEGDDDQALNGKTLHIYLTGAATQLKTLPALTINSGDSATVTFSVNLDTPGNYTMAVSFTNTGDEDIQMIQIMY